MRAEVAETLQHQKSWEDRNSVDELDVLMSSLKTYFQKILVNADRVGTCLVEAQRECDCSVL